MKKLILLIAAVGIAFFTSCEKEAPCPEIPSEYETPSEEGPSESKPEEELTSLAGTSWKTELLTHKAHGDDFWEYFELVFTSTDFVYTYRNSMGNTWSRSGTYTYDRPKVVLIDTYFHGEMTNTGTIEGGIMSISLHETCDVIWEVEFKKQ